MRKAILYVGIDVDDNSYHVSLCDSKGEPVMDFQTGPSSELLVRALKQKNLSPARIKICYEASYIGLSLQRTLAERGYDCKVASPSLIPTMAGSSQKTDKLDARKLARYYAKGLLSFIYIADKEDESVRDLLRSKRFLISQQTMLKNHINGLCRRIGIDYRQETKKKSRWTKHHFQWLEARVKNLDEIAHRLNFSLLLTQLDQVSKTIELYDQKIEEISNQERYKEKVKVLSAFKGVKATTALTLITELGDIKRFDHPRRITSYAGFDLREYSSGGNSKRYGISKMGNSHIRRAAVDAVKFTTKSPSAGPDVRKRRQEIDEDTAKIATKCSLRLYKKGSKMRYCGKPEKKIQVACAREFLGFVWEVLQKAA